MAENTISNEDVLYIITSDSPIREKIMKHLSSVQDYMSITDLANAIGENTQNVNFHCDKLEERNLVSIETPVRKKLIKITEKGLLVWQEIERQKKSQ